MSPRLDIRPRARRLREGERGFTIIEVLVAAIILVLGSLAVFMTFAAAIHNVQRSKESQVGISVAQREMEKVRALSYGEIGLTKQPTPTANTSSPDNRTTGTTFNLNRSGAANTQPLVIGGEGGVSAAVEPGPQTLASIGGAEVEVFRFVVAMSDSSCECSFKRVVIDVLPVKQGSGTYQRSYYELQSDVFDRGGS